LDGGKTWQNVNRGLNPILGRWDIGDNFGSLRFDPRQPDHIYLGAEQSGVFRSTIQYPKWTQSVVGLNGARANGISLAFPFGDDAVVFMGSDGGLNRSTDGAKTWTPVIGGLPDTTKSTNS